MTLPRTSMTHPLRIDAVAVPGGGQIGITICPGKQQAHALTGAWARDLMTDLQAIQAWGATAVISLIEEHEFAELGVAALGPSVNGIGLAWYHLPIADMQAPGPAWESHWSASGPRIRRILSGGGRVVVHCKGGLGRAGTVAARLLIEFGSAPEEAIARVRAARPGAIETAHQERYLRQLVTLAETRCVAPGGA